MGKILVQNCSEKLSYEVKVLVAQKNTQKKSFNVEVGVGDCGGKSRVKSNIIVGFRVEVGQREGR